MPILLVILVGCDAPLGEFPPNEVYSLALEKSRDVESPKTLPDAANITRNLFGTPSEPMWPAKTMGAIAAKLIDFGNVRRAAGLVSSEQDDTHFGLMVEHCATCHAVAGSGNGPASMVQHPYPRDFRPAIFKWKSTLRASKPTREDLRRLLHDGVPGTAMPSFKLLAKADRDALADYVIFLSIRGEVERRLMAATIDELGYDDTEIPESDSLSFQHTNDLISEIVRDVTSEWVAAQNEIVDVPDETPINTESIDRGKKIFHGQIANCAGCHGPGGNGSAVTNDYDDWTKEYTTRLGLTPTDREAIKPFRSAGALRPRKSEPRNLTDGEFHGGGDSETLFRRITQGIAGTPMPGIKLSEDESPTGLTAQQAWDLVHYVQSLSSSE